MKKSALAMILGLLIAVSCGERTLPERFKDLKNKAEREAAGYSNEQLERSFMEAQALWKEYYKTESSLTFSEKEAIAEYAMAYWKIMEPEVDKSKKGHLHGMLGDAMDKANMLNKWVMQNGHAVGDVRKAVESMDSTLKSQGINTEGYD